MNQLLLGIPLLFLLNAEKCREQRPAGTASDTGVVEEQQAPAAGQEEDASIMKVEDGTPDQEGRITGKRWYVISLNEGELLLPEGSERPWLELNDGQLQGFGGCNNLMGSYTLEDDRLSFNEVGSTKMYCPDQQAMERSFIDMLTTVNTFGLEEEEELTLYQGTKEVAVLRSTE